MKKTIGFILILTLGIIFGLTGISCASPPANTLAPTATQITTSTNTTTAPATQIATLTSTPSASDPKPTQVPKMNIAADFIKDSATYKFNGIEGSLKLIKAEEFSPISSFRAMTFIFEYQTRQPGHGDRTDRILAQVITTHTAIIYVDVDKDIVKIATCDNTWDMMTDKELPPPPIPVTESNPRLEITGLVIGGGNTSSPNGPLDTPRKFVYKIQKDDGTFVNVSYMAYPPLPVGDAARAKITFSLYDGSIKSGDYLKAYGTFDKNAGALIVADQGDFIKTYPQKSQQ